MRRLLQIVVLLAWAVVGNLGWAAADDRKFDVTGVWDVKRKLPGERARHNSSSSSKGATSAESPRAVTARST